MPTCSTCRFFVEGDPMGGHDAGACHRFPPAPTSRWPSVMAKEWCGEHQPQ